jgi:hypothetical protein
MPCRSAAAREGPLTRELAMEGTMRIRRAVIIPAILTLGLAGSALPVAGMATPVAQASSSYAPIASSTILTMYYHD